MSDLLEIEFFLDNLVSDLSNPRVIDLKIVHQMEQQS